MTPFDSRPDEIADIIAHEFEFDVVPTVSGGNIVKREHATLDGVRTVALFSKDDRHRFALTRIESGHKTGNVATFVMLNPSTATHEVTDPTVSRCYAFARSWGFTAVHIVNLFSYRSTDPERLLITPDADGGVYNAYAVLRAARDARVVVCAWGAHDVVQDGTERFLPILRKYVGAKLHCLGRTKAGHPKHPLYLASNTRLEPYA